MKILDDIFKDHIVSNIRKKGKCILCDVDNNTFVLKKKTCDINKIYNYLDSRNFDYYPRIVINNDVYNIYEYIDDTLYDNEEKILDLINIISLLHTKTTYYKDMDIDEYKEIYEDLLNKINSIKMYYNNLIDNIEIHVFMSPYEYLIARNISKINASISYSINMLNEWFNSVKLIAKRRVVLLYNNMDINHLIKNKDIYLINWDKSYIDSPIFDLYNLYDKYYYCFDFINILDEYESRYPLTNEEKKLFCVLISIPKIYMINSNELENTRQFKKIIDYIYKSEVLIDKFNNVNT